VDQRRPDRPRQRFVAGHRQHQAAGAAVGGDPLGQPAPLVRSQPVVAKHDSAAGRKAADRRPQPLADPFVGHQPAGRPKAVAGGHRLAL